MRESTKTKIFRILLFLIAGILICKLLFSSHDKQLKGIENLRLKGVVYLVHPAVNNGRYHNNGIIYIKILNSNVKFYDPRVKQMSYCCLIKKGKAEIYDGYASYVTVGDTVSLNIKKREIMILKKGKKIRGRITFPSSSFFEYIKEHGYQKL